MSQTHPINPVGDDVRSLKYPDSMTPTEAVRDSSPRVRPSQPAPTRELNPTPQNSQIGNSTSGAVSAPRRTFAAAAKLLGWRKVKLTLVHGKWMARARRVAWDTGLADYREAVVAAADHWARTPSATTQRTQAQHERGQSRHERHLARLEQVAAMLQHGPILLVDLAKAIGLNPNSIRWLLRETGLPVYTRRENRFIILSGTPFSTAAQPTSEAVMQLEPAPVLSPKESAWRELRGSMNIKLPEIHLHCTEQDAIEVPIRRVS